MLTNNAVPRTDRAGGLDARIQLPAATSLNLEYAREWKAGGLDMAEATEDDLVFVQLARRTNVFSLDAIYADIGEHFYPETGFVPRVDRRGVVIRSRYNKQYKGTVERLRGEAEYERLANHAGELTNHRARFSGLLGVKDFFFLVGPEWYYHVDEDNKPFTDRTARFFMGWFPPKYVQIRNTGSFGIRDNKDTFFIRRKLRSVRLLNSVLSLSYSDFTKSNQTKHSGNFRNGRDVLS